MGAFSHSLEVIRCGEALFSHDEVQLSDVLLKAKDLMLKEYAGFPDDIAEIERAFKGITPCPS